MILILTQTFAPATGGMETLLTGLAEQLAEAGHRVLVLADRARGAATYTPTGYQLRRFGGLRPLRVWRKRRAAARVAADAEIVFCDSWKSAEALPRELKGRAAVLAHGAEFPPEPGVRKARRIVRALSGVGCVIANSRFTAEAVRGALPAGAQVRVEIVNPPFVPALAPEADAQARIRASIAGRAPVLCTLARLEPRKGVDKVIAALPEIAARHPDCVFLVGGAGADEARLRTLARDNGVEDRVLFLGRLGEAEKAAMFACADLFVMPVRREGQSVEGFGIVYLEAAGFGVPALGGLDGGAADAVIDGDTGLLCDGNDQAAVSAALLRLLDNDEERAAMGAAAQARAMHDFTWKATLPRYLAAAGHVTA